MGTLVGVGLLGYWWYQHWRQPAQAIIEVLQPATSSSTASQVKDSLTTTPKPSGTVPAYLHSGPQLIAQAEREPIYQNSLGMSFLPLCRYANGTTVWLAIHETRIQDYATYLHRSTYSMQGQLSGAWREIGKSMATASGQRKNNSDGTDHPVSYVHGGDATTFCTWLTAEEQRQDLPAQDSYRLPTVAEWTLAATDPETKDHPFPWGSTYPPEWDAGNLGLNIDGYAATAPVQQFPANKLGYYDLCGNVRELCFSKDTSSYVWCGSNWSSDDKDSMFISYRISSSGRERCMGAGFRCVLERHNSALPKTQR